MLKWGFDGQSQQLWHVRANPDVRPWWHSLDLHTWWMLRNCWGGVGWGRDDDILWTWKHGGCYAHMVDATQLLGWGGVGSGWWHSLNLHTWWMLRNCWGGVGGQSCFGKLVQWNSHTQPTRCIWLPEARLANRRCRKRIEAWGSRRKDCMIWAVPRKKGSECGTGKGQGCSGHVFTKGFYQRFSYNVKIYHYNLNTYTFIRRFQHSQSPTSAQLGIPTFHG